MKVVIDTNILISAIIKDSVTRKIIVESGWKFYYPEISLQELREHKNLILNKSGLTENEYSLLLERLMSLIEIVPQEHANERMGEARSALGYVDPDDVVFLAAALSIDNSIIWSNDADFDKQDKVTTIKTHQIAKFFLP